MESDEVEYMNYKQQQQLIPSSFPNPFVLCTNLVSLQAEIISSCIVSLVSPFFSIISFFSGFFFRRREAESPPEDDQDQQDLQPVVPSKVATAGGGIALLRRMAMGLLAAAYVCVVLIIVMVVAAVLGVAAVRSWAEEPVYVRETLHFDYTDAHPTAVFSFGNNKQVAAAAGVSVSHTLYVSLLLLMPESDYNRDVGIFQLTAELISAGGDIVAKSGHPCMLQFRSWPIRVMRTFLMGVPLLLGITTETQVITFPILKHKEAIYPRTEEVRITLIPRAGTLSLPQFYDAEVVIKSRPPWTKEFVHRWKWTFYVWTTFYVFIVLVMFLVFFLKPLMFPTMVLPFAKSEQDSAVELASPGEPLARTREEREVSESLRRWQRSRSKRKAALLHGLTAEGGDSSASSITMTHRDEGTGESLEEESGDSESVCFRGTSSDKYICS